MGKEKYMVRNFTGHEIDGLQVAGPYGDSKDSLITLPWEEDGKKFTSVFVFESQVDGKYWVEIQRTRADYSLLS